MTQDNALYQGPLSDRWMQMLAILRIHVAEPMVIEWITEAAQLDRDRIVALEAENARLLQLVAPFVTLLNDLEGRDLPETTLTFSMSSGEINRILAAIRTAREQEEMAQ